METFNPKHLQKNLGSVFNSVQANGSAIVDSRSRPDMVLVLKGDFDAMKEKIRQLTDLVKAQ